MALPGLDARSLNRASMLSTVIDAGVALRRGRRRRAAVLLGAAALASRFPGLGTAASVLVRVLRRFR